VDPWSLGYELAGIIGVHPRDWSLRELFDAVRGRRREEWNHTCAVLAQLTEIHRDPKKRSRPYDASEFHPMREKPQVPIATPEQVKELI